ncbi:hypothetical protein JK167_08000 [Levilactobacillus brevis]|uniref:Uncharacterized protein n=2 Tax=Levilactobacillus brevis TaxID=1580 RepID=A0AA41EQ42_LEVBR|nr:hypothetical protein [Levilactobacillus brevis]MBS1010766.1 hypothetical protein [Levilactobacillus brevis]
MIKVKIDEILHRIPTSEGTQYLSDLEMKEKSRIVSLTFTKLLNDEVFYRVSSSQESGILDDFLAWIDKTMTNRQFFHKNLNWSMEQLVAFWTIIGSNDLYERWLPDRKESFESLIIEAMGMSQYRNGIKKLDLKNLKQVGLKRIVIPLSEDDNKVIREIEQVMEDRAKRLSETLMSGVKNIDYQSIWKIRTLLMPENISPDRKNDGNLYPNELERLIYNTVMLNTPLERNFTNYNLTNNSRKLLNISKAINEISDLNKYSIHATTTVNLTCSSEIEAALKHIIKAKNILKEIKKKS